MPEYSQMGVRLTKDQREALDRISEKTGVEVAQLIRFAVEALINHFERCGGKLVLPIDFADTMPARNTVALPAEGQTQPKPKRGKSAA